MQCHVHDVGPHTRVGRVANHENCTWASHIFSLTCVCACVCVCLVTTDKEHPGSHIVSLNEQWSLRGKAVGSVTEVVLHHPKLISRTLQKGSSKGLAMLHNYSINYRRNLGWH